MVGDHLILVTRCCNDIFQGVVVKVGVGVGMDMGVDVDVGVGKGVVVICNTQLTLSGDCPCRPTFFCRPCRRCRTGGI